MNVRYSENNMEISNVKDKTVLVYHIIHIKRKHQL